MIVMQYCSKKYEHAIPRHCTLLQHIRTFICLHNTSCIFIHIQGNQVGAIDIKEHLIIFSFVISLILNRIQQRAKYDGLSTIHETDGQIIRFHFRNFIEPILHIGK
ncbi:hypothetical protein D3C76_1301210 [compost metagenome]